MDSTVLSAKGIKDIGRLWVQCIFRVEGGWGIDAKEIWTCSWHQWRQFGAEYKDCGGDYGGKDVDHLEGSEKG